MRFMLLMIPKDYRDAPREFTPDASSIARLMKFNEELLNSAVLLAFDGLHPPASGARVTQRRGKTVVTPGPFPRVKEVLSGYWIIDVPTLADAVAWAARCPAERRATIEVRQVHEPNEFPPAVQQAGAAYGRLKRRLASSRRA